MSSTVNNIKIEPMNVSWQIEEQEQFDFATGTAAGLGGKYVLLWSANDAVAYYAWFDENNTDTDPAVSGKTAIEVNYAASASASAIATAFSTAVNAVTGFDASVSGTVVTVTRTVAGTTTSSTIGNATGFVTVTLCQEGGNLDLGLLDGDTELTFEESTFEVTAQQTGTTLLADLRQGVSAEIGLTLKESDNAKLKEVFAGAAGGTHTPVSGTEMFGWGKSRQGSNTIIQARRLVLHPVALGSTDYTRDICFWKAYPMPDTMTISGENPKVTSITFKTYLDSNKPDAIQLFAIGNWTQLSPV
jgi:hypothetical protein